MDSRVTRGVKQKLPIGENKAVKQAQTQEHGQKQGKI